MNKHKNMIIKRHNYVLTASENVVEEAITKAESDKAYESIIIQRVYIPLYIESAYVLVNEAVWSAVFNEYLRVNKNEFRFHNRNMTYLPNVESFAYNKNGKPFSIMQSYSNEQLGVLSTLSNNKDNSQDSVLDIDNLIYMQ